MFPGIQVRQLRLSQLCIVRRLRDNKVTRRAGDWGKSPLSLRPFSAQCLAMVGQQTFQGGGRAHNTPATGGPLPDCKLPVGAEITPDGVHFRVWAPNSRKVSVQLISTEGTKSISLESESEGYFSGIVA